MWAMCLLLGYGQVHPISTIPVPGTLPTPVGLAYFCSQKWPLLFPQIVSGSEGFCVVNPYHLQMEWKVFNPLYRIGN